MALTDYSYFVGDINLPQAATTEGRNTITRFIDIHEEEFLQRLLGMELWKAFTTGIAGNAPAQKWLDLRDGKEFTNLSGRLCNWKGFINTLKRSPIAFYVYVQFISYNATHTSTSGEVSSTMENGEVVSPRVKLVEAWDKMVDHLLPLKEFLDANISTYPEWGKQPVDYTLFTKTNLLGI